MGKTQFMLHGQRKIDAIVYIAFTFLLFKEYVCNRLAGAGGGWESATFTWEVLQKHPGTVPGIFQSHTHPHNTNKCLFTEYWVNVWLPLLAGMEWIIRRLWRSQLSHRDGRIPASCGVWLYWHQVSHQSRSMKKNKSTQHAHSDYTLFLCVLFLEFRRIAWLFPHFFPKTFLSFASVEWTTWAVRWTGCWGKMKFVSLWGNMQSVLGILSPTIYRLSWRHQEPESLSHQVTHKQRQAITAHFC